MDDLFQWTTAVELAAARTYRLGAAHFASEPALSGFLEGLAKEEEWHASLLASVGDAPRPFSPVLPGPETCDKVLGLFQDACARLESGAMTQDEMCRTIVAAEFSEWNEFFLYALGTLRSSDAEFALAVSEIERHKEGIIAFFGALPDGWRYLEVLRDLPRAGGKRILLIERRAPLAMLLRRALTPIGEVVVAESGAEGLARIAQQPFDVVLSDVDLGAMDSLEFYRRAVSVEPGIALRCVFFAGGGEGTAQMTRDLPGSQLVGQPAFIEQICRTVSGVARGESSSH